jgi:hypothetical protein
MASTAATATAIKAVIMFVRIASDPSHLLKPLSTRRASRAIRRMLKRTVEEVGQRGLFLAID